MERLRGVKKHLTLFSFCVFTAVLLAAGTANYLLTQFTSENIAMIGTSVVLVLGILIASLSVANTAVKSTEFLARAILHVASEQSTVSAPDLSLVPSDTKFFETLAKQVYDLASQALPGPAGTTAVSNDSTANFQKALLMNTPLPIYVFDGTNNLTYANQCGIDFAKLKVPDSIGKPLHDVLALSFAGDETLESWLNTSKEQRVTDTHSWDRVRVQLGDDTVRQCDMSVRFNKDNPDGVETVVVLFDHTARYTADDRAASFVSMAVHELRTPLTVMRGYIELFEDEISSKLDPEQAEFMRNMNAQAQQLAAFVNNIQNFTRIEDNQFSVLMKDEDWAEIVRTAIADMELRARVRHKTIQTEIEENLPHAAVDRATINEVIVNIVENAIKYTRSDEPIIVRAYKKDDGFIETTVEDKGIGIPAAVIGQIFDKFYRSHRSNKAVGGTGLGLYLSKAIVSAHGGQIWVKSKEGEGTTFGFTVPTVDSVHRELSSADDATIVRGAHGWIKNHSLYRGN